MNNKSPLGFPIKALILALTLTITSCKGENHAKPVTKEVKETSSTQNSPDNDKRRAAKMSLIRYPAVAGAFYPSSPEKIKSMIGSYLKDAKVPETDSRLLGLIVPHAGYIYSGPVAGYSYKTINDPDKIETIILLGPSHRAPFKGISVFPGGIYKTPLGDLTIDEEIASELSAADDEIKYVAAAHVAEHSLEVQLPFIQTIFKDVKIVTAIFGSPDREAEEKFIDKVIDISKRKNVLFIASSDFSHYFDYETAKSMDKSAFESILQMSADELMNKNYKRESELCGLYPVLTLIKIMNLLGGTDAKLLNSANSGDVPVGDKSQVVGYAAVAFYEGEASGNKAEADEAKSGGDEDDLNADEKRKLLKIAQDTIHQYVKSRKRLQPGPITDEKLRLQNGAFVTIKKKGDLRGCIGNFTSEDPLYETIINMAISAATQDPRFPPVVESELDSLELEISVLSPLREIKDISEIEVGKHGIYIIKGFFRGVLLPQVATEYGWDRITFLEQTSRKAGLPKDAWKDKDTQILIFSAQVFSEQDI